MKPVRHNIMVILLEMLTHTVHKTLLRLHLYIQPSQTHSYYSDKSMDNSSVIEDMFRDDVE